jgi:aminoglycoside/choline kinase family phosphotransferase
MKLSKDFKEIKGDASFRKFYRNTKKNSIIVFANIEKIKNLLIYDAINKILIKNDIIAPKLLSQNYKKNYIEIQDLGNKTIYQILIKNKKNHYLILKKAIDVLNKIQKIKDKKIKNFKNKIYKIKDYKNKILSDETKLFNDWYVPKKLNKKNIKIFNNKFNKENRKNCHFKGIEKYLLQSFCLVGYVKYICFYQYIKTTYSKKDHKDDRYKFIRIIPVVNGDQA